MIKLWNLNSICHLHYMGFITNFFSIILIMVWYLLTSSILPRIDVLFDQLVGAKEIGRAHV